MRMKSVALTALTLGALAALSGGEANAQKANSKFTWTLTNRFRLLRDGDEQKFGQDFSHYQVAAHKGQFDLDPRKFQYGFAHLTDRPYRTYWNPQTAQYDIQNYVSLQMRPAKLSYAGGTQCRWTVNGAPVSSTKCKGADASLQLGQNQATVSVDGGSPVPLTMRVEDYFAVVIGDSTASGEGNPEVPVNYDIRQDRDSAGRIRHILPAQWLDERCHRSMISAPLIALYHISQKRTDRSVTVVDYACSGAEINNGIMDDADSRPYQGRETPDQLNHFFETEGVKPSYFPKLWLPAQITQADGAIKALGGKREPDLVILTTGANDIDFTTVLTKLLKDCPDDKCLTDQTAKDLQNKIAAFGERYARLHKRVMDWHPKQVLMTGYMDPTHGSDGKAFCTDKYTNLFQPHFLPPDLGLLLKIVLHGGLDSAKSKFAYDSFVAPLTEKLGAIAAAYQGENWRFLRSPTIESASHGICSQQRWDILFDEAAIKQGVLKEEPNPDPLTKKDSPTIGGVPSGTMHPNVFAHIHVAAAIEKALAP